MSAIRAEGAEYLQISAPISPGNSGSPVFDAKGGVVGVVCLTMKDSQNLNFAIAASHVARLIASPAPTTTPLAVVLDTEERPRQGKNKTPEIGTAAELAAVRSVYVSSDFTTPEWYGIVESLRRDGAVEIAESVDKADAVLVYGGTSFTLGTQTYNWADILGSAHSSITTRHEGAHGQGYAARVLEDKRLRLLWASADSQTERLDRAPEVNFALNFARAVRAARDLASPPPPPPPPPPAPEPYDGPRMTVSMHAGLAAPTESLNEDNDVARSFGLGIAYQVDDILALNILAFGYDEFPVDESQVRNTFGSEATEWSVSGGEIRVHSVLTGIRIRGPWTLAPFFLVDMGYFHRTVEDLTARRPGQALRVSGQAGDGFGLSFGTGLESRLSTRSTAFTEVLLNSMTSDSSVSYMPVRAGLRVHW